MRDRRLPDDTTLSTLLWATCLVLAALLWPWSIAQAEAVGESDKISIGVTADNAPYSFLEGRALSGYSADILREISFNSGLEFEFRAGSWPELYEAFVRGELDAIDAISYRGYLSDKVLFTDPYHIRQTYMMEDSGRPTGPIESIDDLKAVRLGVVESMFYLPYLEDQDVDMVTYDSIPSMVRALAFGWVDVIIGPRLSLEYHADTAGFYFLNVTGAVPFNQRSLEDLRIGVQKDQPELFETIQTALKKIPESRKVELLRRWQEFGGAQVGDRPAMQLNDREQRFLQELGPIRVGIVQDYAPFSFREGGRLQGFSVDVINRLAEMTGLQIIPVSGQWSDLLNMFREGRIDILANMSLDQERLSFTQFTDPYYIIPNVAFTRDGGVSMTNITDLKGYDVAITGGIFYEKDLKNALGDAVKVFTSQEAMFQALEHDRVDVVLSSLPNGNYWVRQLNIPGVRIAGEVNFEDQTGEDLRFGIQTSLDPLAEILNKAMASISTTEMRSIENRWLGASMDINTPGPSNLNLSTEEQAWLEAREYTLPYCVDHDWMPLEGIDSAGNHTGLSAEALRMFSERTQIRFKLVRTKSWQETLEAAQERECDLLPLAMKTPERSRYLSFTDPYVQVPNIVLGRIETPFIEGLGDLRNRKIGVVKGYAFAELLKYRYPSLKLVEVENESVGLKLLQENELAGYITTLPTASYHMQDQGLADLKVIGRIPADWSLSVATRNDEAILLSIMQKVVSSLSPEERRNLESYWRDVRIEQSVDYTVLWQVLAIALIGASLLVYWNRKLDRLNRELAVANDTLARLSVTDDLTQLGNRSYFDREFRKSFQWCQRNETGLAVAMVDADHFKAINDTYGHEAGDHCLIALADVMRRNFRRETDRLSRFGGEEFVIFTSYHHPEEVIERLDRFREAVADSATVYSGKTIHLTISIGLATGVPDPSDTPAEFLRLADQALYQAKQNGRNRLEARAVKE
ncbi:MULTISPECIES: transporter substrate-binding domain-containing protein [Marinobacter]|uniref:Transporter substrate-binding domain-containing protein n=1 Tax=Marinobacter suaedae TaxID=3057675 RepID=A0ABT8VYZ6_9GAMM|nr:MULTISPECIES: transporter substrate-binding domain-containing protein [unclassified Marinobacter]MBZ2169352.1 transporter substrate-binding domain-containing protein [Marinobacter sp. F4216]MDO3721219.1 transporter substrate-binding domain-containing protein [Marinobacter sp. chi1]